MEILIGHDIKAILPEINLGVIKCQVKNNQYIDELWKEINQFTKKIENDFQLDEIKHVHQIKATKEAYKKLGKDPSRYRPSAESLYRRIVKGNDLYQISTVVDILNLVSLITGYSIGGFDLDKIEGKITLGIGEPDEPYEGIGRGNLNIQDLPVYRDEKSAIGTPTSDHIRTSITLNTTKFLMVINDFSGNEADLKGAVDLSKNLLKNYAKGENFTVKFIQ